MSTLSHPAGVMARLQAIEADLATRQNDLEEAARGWFTAKREKEKEHAEEFIQAEGTVAERSARATIRTAMMGMEHEANYEAHKAVVRVLETRANIGMALLKSQGRS